ncbi:MAG: phospholipase D-like domain-containing protein [Thermodesulfobacteriota bacterium]|nr:phospholipase D-like domain-containing protein [Thermodesulfobacteriota bacterium]
MKRIFLTLLFLLSSLTGSPATAEIEALFSTEVNIQEALLKEIETLSETLDLALYEITSADLVQALVRAKERGVRVRVVTDSKQARIKSSRVNLLIKRGISVKTLGGKEKGAMNHHFAILDGKKVITGSHDWFTGSGKGDYESILIIQNNDLADSYQKEFERLWREKRMIK